MDVDCRSQDSGFQPLDEDGARRCHRVKDR